MPHNNTLFGAVLKLVAWDALDEAVARHGGTGHARRFSYKSQLVAMLYAQLAGARSLREVEAGMASHSNRAYHLGAQPPRRATLADANRGRPAAVFADLLGAMMLCAHRGLRRAMQGATLLVDSTSLALNGLSAGWAGAGKNGFGAKLHVVYDPAADRPAHAGLSNARVHDITAARQMPVTPGATYVFDLGYYDYAWWAELDRAGCTIVTRLKRNTPLRVTEERPIPPAPARTGTGGAGGRAAGKAAGSTVLSDRVGFLPERQASRRCNPFSKPVREVQVRLDTGPVLRVLTNDLHATAQHVADLYRQRWAVELFFRWIKQELRIKRFLGTSENAVRIQVATALLAFLLLRMAQQLQAAITSPLQFAQLVRANLMQPRSLQQLHKPPSRTPFLPNQGVLL